MYAGSMPNQYADALHRSLSELGRVEGQNLLIEERYTEGRPERYAALIEELIRLKVDILVAGGGTAGAQVAKRATATIPIVMPVMGDPVAAGLVSSLARPGGNVTGLSMLNTEISAKRVELIKKILPTVERAAVLVPSSRNDHESRPENAAMGHLRHNPGERPRHFSSRNGHRHRDLA